MALAGILEIQLLAEMGRLSTDMKRAERVVQDSTDRMGKSVATLESAFGKLGSTLALGAVFDQIRRMTDDVTKLTAQLRIATHSQQEYAAGLADVRRISTAAQADILATTLLYTRLTNALSQHGATQKQVSNITESVSLGLKAYGATSTEAASAMLQLSQAFGANRLGGEEFRAVSEAMPNMMKILAESMNKPLSALKQLSAEGKITSEVMMKAWDNPAVIEALRKQADMTRTITGEITVFRNNLKMLVGEFMDSSKSTSGITSAIRAMSDAVLMLAENLKIVVLAVTVLSLAYAGKFIVNLARGIEITLAHSEALAMNARANAINAFSIESTTAATLHANAASIAQSVATLRSANTTAAATTVTLAKTVADNAATVAQLNHARAAGMLSGHFYIVRQVEAELVVTTAALTAATEAHSAATAQQIALQTRLATMEEAQVIAQARLAEATAATAAARTAASASAVTGITAIGVAMRTAIMAHPILAAATAIGVIVVAIANWKDIVDSSKASLKWFREDFLGGMEFLAAGIGSSLGELVQKFMLLANVTVPQLQSGEFKKQWDELGRIAEQSRTEAAARIAGIDEQTIAREKRAVEEQYAVDRAAWEKLTNNKEQHRQAEIAALNEQYLKIVQGQRLSQEQQLAELARYNTRLDAINKEFEKGPRGKADWHKNLIPEFEAVAAGAEKEITQVEKLNKLYAEHKAVRGGAVYLNELGAARRADERTAAFAIAATTAEIEKQTEAIKRRTFDISHSKDELALYDAQQVQSTIAALEGTAAMALKNAEFKKYAALLAKIEALKGKQLADKNLADEVKAKEAVDALKRNLTATFDGLLAPGTDVMTKIAQNFGKVLSQEINKAMTTAVTNAAAGENSKTSTGDWVMLVIGIVASLVSSQTASAAEIAAVTAAEVQKRQGTGSVLGDSTAQTNSILNSLDILNKTNFAVSNNILLMVDSLHAVEASMSVFINVLAKSLGGDIAAAMGVPRTSRTPTLMGGRSTELAGYIEKYNTLQFGPGYAPIAAQLNRVAPSVSNAVWGSNRTNVTDTGLQISGTLGGLAAGNGVNLYASGTTTSSGLFNTGLGGSTSTWTETQAASAELAKSIADIYTNIRDTFKAVGAELGMDMSGIDATFNSFQTTIGNLSLEGMTAQEKMDALNKAIGKDADLLATQLFPGLVQFQHAGEGLMETVVRVVTQMAVLKDYYERVGLAATVTAKDAEALATAMGGLDKMAKTLQSYYKNYFSPAEQVAHDTATLAKTFEHLGLTMPKTKEEFRALVEAQDLTTESGRKTYAALMEIQQAYSDNSNAAQELVKAWKSTTDGIIAEVERIRGIMGGGNMASIQARFDAATAKARAGDQAAANMLPGLSKELLDFAAVNSASALELARTQANIAASLETTAAIVTASAQAIPVPSGQSASYEIPIQRTGGWGSLDVGSRYGSVFSSTPAFADGGDFSGGIRLVGERGPELEATGPSRITSTNRLMDALRNPQANSEAVVAELRSVNAKLSRACAELADIRRTNQNMDWTTDKWDNEGTPDIRQEVTSG